MAEFLHFTENNLFATLIAAAIVALIVHIWKVLRDSYDNKKIYDFLSISKANTEFTFRSTEAISSDTKIPESRVAELCSKHPKIKRNEKEKQSWKIAR